MCWGLRMYNLNFKINVCCSNLLDHGVRLIISLDDVIQGFGHVQEHRVDAIDHDGRP
jgi:hypothetical protein